MGKFIDLSGQRFGRWNVIKLDHMDKESFWLCQCDCGNCRAVRIGDLKNGSSFSCGCYQKEMASKFNIEQNEYNLSGKYGVGYIKSGKEFYFDIEDYDLIKNYKWNIVETGYIGAIIRGTKRKDRIPLHRLILGLCFENNNKNLIVDHIDHNLFDNRKSNLRIVTKLENNWNSIKRKDNTTGYKGVYLDKKYGKYEARISVNKKEIYLGYFYDIEDAALARKNAELKYYGEYRYRGDD